MELSPIQRDKQLRKLKNRLIRHKTISRCNGVGIVLDVATLAALNQCEHTITNNILTWLCIGTMFAIATGQLINEAKQSRVQEQISKLKKQTER